ncbi:MAG: DUF4157 domain-containing protein [Chloroflexi bacterium]|nr:DUF4157 domain-containing protein [Chloroflexota bacterium]
MAELAHKEKTATLTTMKKRVAKDVAGKRPLPTPTLQRALAKPISRPTAVSTPQSSLQRLLASRQIQAKLTLGPVGDKYEQEADAVARQVVGSLSAAKTTGGEPSAQRQEEEDELQMKPTAVVQRQEEEEELQMKPLVQRQEEEEELQMKPLVQRQEEEEELQAKGDSMMTGGELSGEVETAVTSAKSGGRPLDDTIRAPMEQAFQADFSGVKIHTGGEADSLNKSLSARAFTSGQDVFFRSGEYNPGSTGGQELLAHELTHTIQQGSAVQRRIQRYTKIPVAEQAVNYWQGLNADLRVSDDGNMAVKHIDGAPSNSTAYQEFYATPAILQHSSNVLQGIGSAFTIAQGGATLVGTKPNSKWDKWRKNYKTLYKADISNQDLARTGRGDHSFNACSANTSNFLGVLRSEPGDPNRLEQRRNIILKLEGAIDHANKQINVGEDIGAALVEARKIVTGENTSGEAKTAYNEMWEAMRGWISWRYGVNESAVPDVGEAWAIMQGGTGGRSGMGHFAPVVAKSGSDSVTLENDVSQTAGQVRAQIGDLNPNWYMRMFGPVKRHLFSANEDQTFWGEAKKNESADYGDRPLVGRLGSA